MKREDQGAASVLTIVYFSVLTPNFHYKVQNWHWQKVVKVSKMSTSFQKMDMST